MSLTGNTGNQKDRMMNGRRCRGNSLPALHQSGVQNSHGAVHTVHRYLPCIAEAVKGEHFPGPASEIRSDIRSDIRSHMPGGIVPGGDA